VVAISTAIGAIGGDFSWGPVDDITIISSKRELGDTFGKPTDENFLYYFSASSFLSYSNNLRVVRSDQVGALNAVAGSAASPNVVKIKNEQQYDTLIFDESDGYFAARYPGDLGNSLKITFCLANEADFQSWTSDDGEQNYFAYFDTAPGTSDYCADRGVYNDEIHMLIIDEKGVITGTPNTILERYQYASLCPSAKAVTGESSYYKNVLINQSKWVYWLSNDPILEAANAGQTLDWIKLNTTQVEGQYVYYDASGSPATPFYSIYEFSNGSTGEVGDVGVQKAAYERYFNTTEVDVSLIIGGPTPIDTNDGIGYCNYLIGLAETRGDAMAFVSPPTFGPSGSVYYEDPETAISFTDFITSSSYGVMDSAAMKVYDSFNGSYRWIPANGSIAGLCARTDDTVYPWFSPAGYNRGQLMNTVRISYNPDKTDRDELYKKRINPIVQFPGEGTILFGDKTLLAKSSAFSRINVRRLFIVLEKSISTFAKYLLFEFNDEFTRARFVNIVEPFLRGVQANRGITDFRVVCDETNNTPDIIDSNEFIGEIYIKPNRSINFITLSFVATRTGVSFDEAIVSDF